MNKITTKKYESHEQWLDLRKNGIGGSDAASIVGLNRYSSPYMVWLDKIGKSNPIEPNEAMRQGTDLEEYVAQRFKEKTGKKLRKRNCIIQNADYPFAIANVDRWVVGENAGLECKTINPKTWARYSDDEFPTHYYIQCLHYMAVTGADKYYLAVLVLGEQFKVYEFERDPDTVDSINELMELEKEFWDYVETKTPPPVDGSPATDKALSINYSSPDDKTVELSRFNSEADYLQELKQEKAELDRKIAEVEQKFKQELGDYTVGETDRFKITWKPQTRKTFDSKRFIKDHPDIDFSGYFNERTSRVFRFREL